MKVAFWLFGCWCAISLTASAADWQIYRIEGRDYVSLDDIARFYGLPPPPPISTFPSPVRSFASVPSVPTVTLTSALANRPWRRAASSPVMPLSRGGLPSSKAPFVFFRPNLPQPINLDSGTRQLEVTPKSREIIINGARQWLAFAAQLQDTRLLISRLDLSKVIEPRLRPECILGLKPVKTVVLDPGHGGHDKGALSRYGSEKDFALDVALRARRLLENRGYEVAMTRTTDVFIPLEDRPRLAMRVENSIFVSIHFNASEANREARGFEIFSMAPRGAPATNDATFSNRVLREDPGNACEVPSAALAGAIYHSLLGNIPTLDRGLKHARFAVLRLSTVPAILVECGFVTNLPESAQIGSAAWRERVALAIVDGIDGYKELAVNKQAPKLVAEYRRSVEGLIPDQAPASREGALQP